MADLATSTVYGELTVTGDIKAQSNIIAQGTVTQGSDKALKEDIKMIEYGLEDVLLLDPVSFRMKTGGIKSLGFIAQDMKPIIPELVYWVEGGLSISYANLTAVLVKAIQELKQEVDELKQQLNKEAL